MCLAVPGRILAISGEEPLMRTGRVDFGGLVQRVNLAYVPEAQVDDHVLVHVGFAVSVIDEAEAQRVFALLREIDALDEIADESTGAEEP
jgi:hydrogenase expression/formation protein HypC